MKKKHPTRSTRWCYRCKRRTSHYWDLLPPSACEYEGEYGWWCLPCQTKFRIQKMVNR